MFRSINIFSTLADPVPCPALLDGQQCTIPQCFFSHNVQPPPPPPAPPPAEPFTASAEADSNKLPPLPPTQPTTSVKTVDLRLKKIVEEKKLQDVAVRDKRPRSADGGSATKGAAADVDSISRTESVAGNRVAGASVLAESSSWPTPAQSSKKAKLSKGEGIASDTSCGPQTAQQPSKSKATAANKAAASGALGIMKTATAIRPLKRPAPDSPNSSVVPKTDPLKRPKTTIAMSTKAVDPQPAAGPAAKSTAKSAAVLNPRLISRSPATHSVRMKCLQLLHGELTRLSGEPKDDAAAKRIIDKCLDMEEEVATKKREIYRSAIGKVCMRYKKMTPAEYQAEVQAELAAKSAPAAKQPATIKSGLNNSKPPVDTGLSKSSEIERLRSLVISPEVLKKHGYIMSPPTEAEIEQARAGLKAAGGYEQCERCNQRFQVFPGRRASDGALTTGGLCNFHPGRKLGLRPSPGSTSEQKWTCCNRIVGFDTGCDMATTHVFKVTDPKRLALSLPFSKTPPNPSLKDQEDRVLALDCEMSYTTLGMELIRLTATAFPSGKIVIDGLVNPTGIVLDFNTRFSGVSSEMLSSAPQWRPKGPYPDAETTELINPTFYSPPKQLAAFTSPEHARQTLYHYISPETILIGHALENDLLHLRMCHDAIVDTVVLFPHTRGLPLRNKLKYIVERFLGREIQVDGGDSGLDGHDSAVDARCAAELCRLKIKEAEARKKR